MLSSVEHRSHARGDPGDLFALEEVRRSVAVVGASEADGRRPRPELADVGDERVMRLMNMHNTMMRTCACNLGIACHVTYKG